MMRIDLMKVSSLEIIITFYMATHMPLQDVSKFVLSEEQQSTKLPFLNNLVAHMLFSGE